MLLLLLPHIIFLFSAWSISLFVGPLLSWGALLASWASPIGAVVAHNQVVIDAPVVRPPHFSNIQDFPESQHFPNPLMFDETVTFGWNGACIEIRCVEYSIPHTESRRM